MFNWTSCHQSGAAVPACCSGREEKTFSGGGDQPAERCRGHALLQPAGFAPGSGILGEAESRLPDGDRQGISRTVSCEGETRVGDFMFFCFLKGQFNVLNR